MAPALLWRGTPVPESSGIQVNVVGKSDSTTTTTTNSFAETEERKSKFSLKINQHLLKIFVKLRPSILKILALDNQNILGYLVTFEFDIWQMASAPQD